MNIRKAILRRTLILWVIAVTSAFSAVVEIATNGVTIGGTTDSVIQPQGNVSGQVFGPTYFLNHVYLEDDTQTPLHLRLPVGTNSTEAIVQAVLEQIANPFTEATKSNNWWEINVGYGGAAGMSFNGDVTFEDGIFVGDLNVSDELTLGGETITSWGDISFDPIPVFTNGAAAGLVLSNMPYSTFINGDFAQKPGIFWFGDYKQMVIHGGGENAPSIILVSDGADVPKGIYTSTNMTVHGNMEAASFTLGTNTITEWPTGGGGLSCSRVVTTNSSVAADDYLIWLDTRAFSSSSSVTLTLLDMAEDSQTIVVRRLGNDGTATIARGTNTWTLGYDGDGVTVDWVVAATNWYWRSF